MDLSRCQMHQNWIHWIRKTPWKLNMVEIFLMCVLLPRAHEMHAFAIIWYIVLPQMILVFWIHMRSLLQNIFHDYEELVNRVQRKTKCTEHTCLCKKGNKVTCRYIAPLERERCIYIIMWWNWKSTIWTCKKWWQVKYT